MMKLIAAGFARTIRALTHPLPVEEHHVPAPVSPYHLSPVAREVLDAEAELLGAVLARRRAERAQAAVERRAPGNDRRQGDRRFLTTEDMLARAAASQDEKRFTGAPPSGYGELK